VDVGCCVFAIFAVSEPFDLVVDCGILAVNLRIFKLFIQNFC